MGFNMKYLYKLTMPVYGNTTVDVKEMITELKNRLKFAKQENKHFDWKIVSYVIAQDEDEKFWLCGLEKGDFEE